MPTATQKEVKKSASELEAEIDAKIAALLDRKAVSSGSKNLAAEFEKIARANGHVVTFDQAKALSPKSPSDAAFYFRQAGGKVVTQRGKAGQTSWVVTRPIGYPDEVKAEIARLQSQKTDLKKAS